MLIGRDINYHVHNSEEHVDNNEPHMFHSADDLLPMRPPLAKLDSCCSIDDDLQSDILTWNLIVQNTLFIHFSQEPRGHNQ